MGNDAVIDTEPVFVLLAQARGYFARQLASSAMVGGYLHSRGISGEIAQRFGLGYARPRWRDLVHILQRFDDSTALASGLLVCHGDEAGNVRFDRFRDRVMFPIRNLDGRVAGFGGRAIGAGCAVAKYINSPEGPVFRKRELVYGLYEAQEAIRAGATAVMMEGYLDVLTSVQAGMVGAVGSLGTSCSAAQLEQVFALGSRLVFCFDGDPAGRAAVQRALATVLPLATDERSIAFAVLPDGHDPDSLVRKRGAAALHAAIAEAVPLRSFLLDQLSEGCDFRWAEGRAQFLARAAVAWAALPVDRLRSWLEARTRDVLQTADNWVREYLAGGAAVTQRAPSYHSQP